MRFIDVLSAAALLTSVAAAPASAQKAMIYGNDAVSTPDSVTLPNVEAWFTQNYAGTGNGTQVPSYWVNKVGGELSSVIQTACAQSLNMSAYNQLSNCLAGQHGRLLAVYHLTASGSFTPDAGTNSMEIQVIGGGGPGGSPAATDGSHYSVGSGGASGSYADVIYTGAPFGGFTVTIGVGGVPGTTGTAGGSGGTTVFGSISCPGGGYGGIALAPSGAAGAAGQGLPGSMCSIGSFVAVVNTGGQPGPNGLYFPGSVASGQGAPSQFGGGAPNTISGNGNTAGYYGGGGAGGACSTSCAGATGGYGGPGLVIVREYS